MNSNLDDLLDSQCHGFPRSQVVLFNSARWLPVLSPRVGNRHYDWFWGYSPGDWRSQEW